MVRDLDIGFPELIDNSAIYHELSHRSYLFPDLSEDIDLTCTFTSGAIDTFGTWAEIADSDTNKMTTIVASNSIHISSIAVRSTSEADVIYVIELGYGLSTSDVTVLNPFAFGSGTKQINSDEQRRFRSLHIPKGQKVYYRMKTENTLNATATVVLRYHIR